MCGIGGILFSKSESNELKRRNLIIQNAQLHRGPDAQEIWIDRNHSLCHQRLSIIDIEHGQQPMADNSGRYILCYNGEIYNYKELRKKLSAHYQFITNSDTEVVLASYIIWGKKCMDKFIGMFSFIIWDTIKEEGFAARDILGVKPFVYAQNGSEFIFASETKAILKILPSNPKLNKLAFAETIIAPSLSGVTDSLLEGINILQAGCYLEISKNGIKETSYTNWNITPVEILEEDAVNLFQKEFKRSITYSLESDVEVGCFLSGGLDSSYIAAQMSDLQKSTIQSFGIRFENHNDIVFSPDSIVGSNDKPYTEFMASKYKLQHNWVEASKESIRKSLKNIAVTNDRICTWEQEIAQHFLSIKASANVKTVLVGDAADETNFGYFFLLNQEMDKSPFSIANFFGAEERIKLLNPTLEKQYNFKHLLNEKYTQIAKNAGFSFNKNKEERMLATSSLINKLWLGRLLHNGDIHTMNSSLEARVPFANQNLLSISRQISPELGFKNGVEKNIVRKAARGILHDKIRLRKKSALPRDPRLASMYQQLIREELKKENPFIDNYLNRPLIKKLSTENGTIPENNRMMLFNILAAIYWSKEYIS